MLQNLKWLERGRYAFDVRHVCVCVRVFILLHTNSEFEFACQTVERETYQRTINKHKSECIVLWLDTSEQGIETQLNWVWLINLRSYEEMTKWENMLTAWRCATKLFHQTANKIVSVNAFASELCTNTMQSNAALIKKLYVYLDRGIQVDCQNFRMRKDRIARIPIFRFLFIRRINLYCRREVRIWK